MKKPEHRIEHDLLGDREVPINAYYGVHTLRATENFPITGASVQIYPTFIAAIAYIKEACAVTNNRLGLLDDERTMAIAKACREVRSGKLHEHFVVDVIQGGAGTSMNMNANEVIANRALEIMGHRRGEYQYIHPLDHVNMSQSTNDVYPSAIKVALRFEVDKLIAAIDTLYAEFDQKAQEFAHILKMGRTQLQEAVPMTLGQEFSTYAGMLASDRKRLLRAARAVQELNMGATAIGTGINTLPQYAPMVCEALSNATGYNFTKATNLIESTQDMGAFVELSGSLRQMAVKISKICNDLRLLSSGPRAGLGEINLPAVQAGSSIMPGKINPVIPEVVNQVAFEVIGNDVTISFAAEAGQLQLNAFEPVIAYNLLNSLIYMRQGCLTLAQNCVRGITANQELLKRTVANSVGIVTALNPHIGYANASAVAKEATQTGKGVSETVIGMGLMTQAELDEILRPEILTAPHLSPVPKNKSASKNTPAKERPRKSKPASTAVVQRQPTAN
ncbi:MAG TPA: aspartate ammonia-lyase [Candidatus Saccharimonadales bacterium]|nr:aspartate ammonia-lyase [Candidatus Saccharimonadales bacterium]